MNRRRLALIVLVAASTAAALVYLRAQGDLRLALVDRSGKSTVLGIVPASTYAPRISPDGRRVVYDAGGIIWIAETGALGSPRRLASGAYPLWSSDGSRVLFIVGAGNRQQLFWQAADGSGAPAMLVDDARAPESWSDAAQVVTYITLKGGSDYDVRARSLQDGTTRAVAALSESNQSSSRVSPDGRWIAYESNDSGAWEVYVEPFPRGGMRSQVPKGGRRPLWSNDGRELFYDREDSRLWAVSFQTDPVVSFGAPRELPIAGFVQGGARRQYDLAPDGRFMVLLR